MDEPERMHTAVIGGDGYLGRAFLGALRMGGADPFSTSRRQESAYAHYDLKEPACSCLPLRERGVENAIIAAGVGGKMCDEHPVETRAVNVEGTVRLIRTLWAQDVLPVFLSTDNVFDGMLSSGAYGESSPRAPATEYGRQKAEVEHFLEDSGMPFLTVRLSKVFSLEKGDGTLLDEMARSLVAGQTVRAAFDQVFCPTLLDDVVKAVLELLDRGIRGVVHVCSPEPWSRYDLALALAGRLGCVLSLVERVSLDGVFPGLKRPKYTVMSCGRLEAECGLHFAPMTACLDAVAGNYR